MSYTDNVSQIPDRHIEFCRKIVEMAKEHGLGTFNCEFVPSRLCDSYTFDPYNETITFKWARGRHDAMSKFCIESKQRAWLEV